MTYRPCSAARRTRRPRLLTALRRVLVLALPLVIVGCIEEEPPRELPPRAIRWHSVSTAHPSERRVISGVVTAVADTRLAFEVPGIVQSVAVALGEEIKRGQELARLDPEAFELAVHDAEATLAQARALQEVARADSARSQTLFDARVASRQDLDRAIALRDSRDSQVDAAEARVHLAQRDLRRSVLRAPFAGSVSVRNIDPAMKLSPGQIAFEVDSGESGLRVEVQMPETLITRVRQGDVVEARFPAKDVGVDLSQRRFSAVISEIGSRASVGNAFRLRADLLEAPETLRPGMTAELQFSLRPMDELRAFDGFLIPLTAARADSDDGFSVFVYELGTSTLSERKIRTGGIRGNEIVVFEGLREGDIVASAGVSFLRDGQLVTLLDELLSPTGR